MLGSCAYVGSNIFEIVGIKIYGNIKGQSSLIILQRRSNLKYKFGQRSFWCRGYYVDTVGKNEKKIAEDVRNQLKEDMLYDQ